MQIGAGYGFHIFCTIMVGTLDSSARVTHDNFDTFRAAETLFVGTLQAVTTTIVSGLVVVVTVDIRLRHLAYRA